MFREEEKLPPTAKTQSLAQEGQNVGQSVLFPGAGMTKPPFQPIPGAQTGFFPGMAQGLELARAYIPFQRFGPVFDLTRALDLGTLFPELYRPYPY